MWLWETELRGLGFKRKSDRYWRCDRRHGLPDDAYLSLYPWGEQKTRPDRTARLIVEVSAFHVTFRLGPERIHFYYHEHGENEWRPGGHTSMREIRRVHDEPKALRRRADGVAARLVAAMGGAWQER